MISYDFAFELCYVTFTIMLCLISELVGLWAESFLFTNPSPQPNSWDTARDLMLMSHLQENIYHSDIMTQILYNRAMVQLGLCAFRTGRPVEAQTALSEICQNNRCVKVKVGFGVCADTTFVRSYSAKELLAQGVSFQKSDKTQEEKMIEKRRQTPFHMHINLELVECVYFACSMLQEMPSMAQSQHDPTRTRPLNKSVRRQMDSYCKQAYNGPPENARESIMAASLAMLQGDWKTCQDLVFNIKVR